MHPKMRKFFDKLAACFRYKRTKDNFNKIDNEKTDGPRNASVRFTMDDEFDERHVAVSHKVEPCDASDEDDNLLE